MKEFFNNFVLWIEHSDFYFQHLKTLPAPLNNPTFTAIILLIIFFLIIKAIVTEINNTRYSKRLYEREQLMRAKRLEREEEEIAEREREKERLEQERIALEIKNKHSELMEQYMRFIMMAQMQNMGAMAGISFEEFMNMKEKMDKKEEISEEVLQESESQETEEEPIKEENPDTEEVIEDIQEPKPEYIPSVLVDLVEEEPETLPIELTQIKALEDDLYEENKVEEIQDIIDIDCIVNEKRNEISSDIKQNQFESLLAQLENAKEDMENYDRYINEKEAIKEKNISILDNKINSSITVEGISNKNETNIIDTDFDRRKEQALAQEERERVRAEKKAAKERKKAEKKADKQKKKQKSVEAENSPGE